MSSQGRKEYEKMVVSYTYFSHFLPARIHGASPRPKVHGSR